MDGSFNDAGLVSGSNPRNSYTYWDNQGRFICPFTPDNILAMHGVYVELKNSTSPEGQRKFNNLHFDIGEAHTIPHSEVVFETAEGLAKFISQKVRSGFGEVIGQTYSLPGHPILCVVDPIKDDSDRIKAVSEFIGETSKHVFASAVVQPRQQDLKPVMVRPNIQRCFQGGFKIDLCQKLMVATINPSIEKAAGGWRLNIPITSFASVIPFQTSGIVGAPGLIERPPKAA